ncbi:MAG: hypothetical protein KF861_04020 [Planctomycetaceae bacterium]|nr:hypothetical protein [Planctomycetaceae bacterium]
MPAKVTDIAAVREFKAALMAFQTEATAALESMTMQLQRTLDWVEHDRPAYWNKQLQLGFDRLAQSRSQLNTCLMRTVAGRRPACIEEKQAYERAKRRLAHCQEMAPRVKHWAMKLTHESDEFRGRTSAFARCVENDLPRMIALIERTATALERYAEVAGGQDMTPAAVTPTMVVNPPLPPDQEESAKT